MNLGSAGQLDACERSARIHSKERENRDKTAVVFWREERGYGWDWEEKVPEGAEVQARYQRGFEVFK